MENLFLKIFEEAGVAGLIVFVVLLLMVGIVKAKGWTAFGDKSKVVPDDKLKGISSSLTSIDRRLGVVEHDLKGRPTRREMHDLELSFTRMEGRFEAVEVTARATNSAVARIEDHMIRVSERMASSGK